MIDRTAPHTTVNPGDDLCSQADSYLSLSDLAERLRVSRRTLEDMRARNQLEFPAHKRGKSVLFLVSDVDAALELALVLPNTSVDVQE